MYSVPPRALKTTLTIVYGLTTRGIFHPPVYQFANELMHCTLELFCHLYVQQRPKVLLVSCLASSPLCLPQHNHKTDFTLANCGSALLLLLEVQKTKHSVAISHRLKGYYAYDVSDCITHGTRASL